MSPSPATPSPPPFQLLIFDFDGTLFNTHVSIAHCIRLTFLTLTSSHTPPSRVPTASDILAVLATGAGLEETFQLLLPAPALPSGGVGSWMQTYRALYVREGLPLITPYPGAERLLRHLRVPAVVVTNKGAPAVEEVLRRHALRGCVRAVLGDSMRGVRRKPDAQSFWRVVKPLFDAGRMKAGGGSEAREGGDGAEVGEREDGMEEKREEEVRDRDAAELDPERVLVIGDTEADIGYARNIGAKVAWCRFGYGKRDVCERLEPDWIVDRLEDVEAIVEGR